MTGRPDSGRLPKTFCIGCGHVAPTVHAYLVHVSGCGEPTVRPLVCPGCLTENWPRPSECSECGLPLI